MGLENLKSLYAQRDADDYVEGCMAYNRYRTVMKTFAEHYGFSLSRTTSTFVALSPNSDYHGNLRSLASVLDGINNDAPLEHITVSTYNACRDRAHSYATGAVDFRKTVKGLKTRAFRDNILWPNTSRDVTIDGHMIAAWHSQKLTMTQAARLMKSRHQYQEIADGVRTLAAVEKIAPCQVQAILWLTRKRVLNVKYNAQLDLFGGADDKHQTLRSPEEHPPYPLKRGE